jgi:(S)-citramalyl-CoA lyase
MKEDLSSLFAYSSYLFTPALDISKFSRGSESGAHMTVLDLEDSVPLPDKDNARKNILQFFSQQPSFVTGMRINSLHSQEGIKDIEILLTMKHLPDSIFLSKVSSESEIILVRDIFLSESKEVPNLIAIIESAQGLIHVNDIASVSSGLIFGSADYCADVGLVITPDNLFYPRQMIILAAAANDIICIDTPFFYIKDEMGLKNDCENSKKMGFFAKAALSVSQIKVINNVFRPTMEEILQANQILELYNKVKGGVSVLDNSMIGPPFVLMAKKILMRSKIKKE